ncbi:MAG: DUF4404 family protein [Woeseiaceae bacterium]|nr:DUF4404 family protein [Woeseiaceae bacterium]
MSQSDIKKLLTQLKDELQGAELDADTRSMVQDLDSDIHALLSPEDSEAESASIIERAKALEADFETRHPVAVRVLNEVIETLVKMGL